MRTNSFFKRIRLLALSGAILSVLLMQSNVMAQDHAAAGAVHGAAGADHGADHAAAAAHGAAGNNPH